MIVGNFIETCHRKLLISDIRPRHTFTALAAHLCAAAHRLGTTAVWSYVENKDLGSSQSPVELPFEA